MKLATPFQLHCKYEDVIDEWNINYDPYEYTRNDKLYQALERKEESEVLFNKLITFVKEYSDKRINIAILDEEIPIDHLVTLNKIHDNIHVRLSHFQYGYMFQLQQNNIKFFFGKSLPVTSFTLLDEMFANGVSDIYIADDLCYNLAKVSKRCKEKGVQIRLILNRIPVTSLLAYDDVRAPIFSPRHYEELNKYIDVAEFDCYYEDTSDAYNWSEFNVLYKAWFINHDWYNDLKEINKDLDMFYPVRQELPNFIERKLNCGRRCVYEDTCRKCETVLEIANTLYEDGMFLRKE